MPRPDTVTILDTLRWNQQIRDIMGIEKDRRAQRLLQMCLANEALAERIFYTGAWLGEQLRALGCTEALRRRICFAHGHNVLDHTDPWAFAEQELADYKNGKWDSSAPLGRLSPDPTPEPYEEHFAETFPEIARRRKAIRER